MGHRRTTRATAYALIAVITGACADTNPLEPGRRPPAGAANHTTIAQPQSPLHANSEKYSDKGAKPAIGSAGTASVEARALLGRDGTTTIEQSTGHLDGDASGDIVEKVQLRSVNGNGETIRTASFDGLRAGGYWSTLVAGLLPGAPLQIQSNIRGSDGSTTNVVTLTATVQRRPDLEAGAVTNPPQAYVNTAVHINAVISEINGEVGARADCLLLVDGTQIDQALGIWVDAGDAVSCAFMHTFAVTGTHRLEVRATSVVPEDWDTANNDAASTIDIVLPAANLTWSSTANTHTQGATDTWFETFTTCATYYMGCTYGGKIGGYGRVLSSSGFSFQSYSNAGAAVFPVRLVFSANTGGAPIVNTNAALGAPGTVGCVVTYDQTTSTWGDICSSGTSTSVNVSRQPGSSTYFSFNHGYYFTGIQFACNDPRRSNAYDPCGPLFAGPFVYSYSVNRVVGPGGAFSLGADVTTELALTDAIGRTFVAGGSYAVRSGTSDYDVVRPYHNASSGYYVYDRYGVRHSWNHLRLGSGSGIGFRE